MRARAHDPELDLTDGNAAAVADICRRVDGLPLAVELAAARCALLSPAEIARRLDAALGALGPAARDAPARHQTLRATIDWSHELLTDDEKACFASFAVFSGGATVDAAEAVTGAQLDILDRLVAKSLLVRSRPPAGETRLSMLETVRAYAADRFGESADAAGCPGAPLPPLPRARRAPRQRASAVGREPQGSTSPRWMPTSRTCTRRWDGRSARPTPRPHWPCAARSAATG